MSSEKHQLQSPVLVTPSVCILQLDLVLGKPRGQALHAWQRTLSLPYQYFEHFATHHHNQRWQWRLIYSTSKAQYPQKYTRKRRLAGDLSDLRHGTLVWRPCWISGGYRLEAASRPIALYIVGIREAQGRNQHFMSGTGTWSSGFWLAMADCLGRFGRASHSTSRYHTPPRSWDKSTMHVQCEA